MYEESAGVWPDREQANFWQGALAAAGAQQLEGRDVVDPARLVVYADALWAVFGDLRLRVAGPGAEIADKAELLSTIDRWVAFERRGGQQRMLARDQDYLASWRARLPGEQILWQRAATLVEADVRATSDVTWELRINVHHDEPDWPAPPDAPAGELRSSFVLHEQGWTPPRRPLVLPQLWLDCAGWGVSLPTGATELSDALIMIADNVQDEMMDEIWTTWPQCPLHPETHPLGIEQRQQPSWTCPDTGTVIAPIGSLRAS